MTQVDQVYALGSSEWPDIQLGSAGTIIGRSSGCDCVLVHGSVSRRHAKLSAVDGTWFVQDLDSRFGTFVNGTRVGRMALRTGDAVRFGSGPIYRFDGIILRPETEAPGMSLVLQDVAIRRGGKHLVENASLTIPQGSFVGMIGQSGIGKSLLLGCMAGTIRPTGGRVSVDDVYDVQDNLAYHHSRIGIVSQSDIVFDCLTVEENLRYAAQLRLPELPPSSRRQLIEDVEQKVELAEHESTKADQLSGGQRKRLSIAIELLTRPRLLLLDEPTSGLDPANQAKLMGILRGLAKQGVTVVCSTHTMDMLHYLDSVVVLARVAGSASCVFHDSPEHLLPRFGVRTVADLFDLLQAGGPLPSPSPAAITAMDSQGDVAAASTAPLGSQTWHGSVRPNQLAGASGFFLQQSLIASKRTLLGFWRDRPAVVLALVQPAILSGMVVLTQCNQSRSTPIHFFLVISALWLGMTLTVREIVRERPLYVRDRLAGMRPTAYLAGKLLFAAGLGLAQSILLLVAARSLAARISVEFVAEAMTKATPIGLGIAVLWIVSLCGSVIGLAVSSLSRSERAAVAFLPLILLPQALVSRVGYGHGNNGWIDHPTPLGPIALVAGEIRSGELAPHAKALLGLSLPLISRPSTAALDMVSYLKVATQASDNAIDGYTVLAEWLYLLLLLQLHFLVLFVVFLRGEQAWSLDPR